MQPVLFGVLRASAPCSTAPHPSADPSIQVQTPSKYTGVGLEPRVKTNGLKLGLILS